MEDRKGVLIPLRPCWFCRAPEIVAAKTVLVPPVINRSNITGKYKQERRQRTQFINPHPLLKLHPFLNLGSVVSSTPSLRINNHDSCVEIASLETSKSQGERRVGPEGQGEVGCEISIAILRCSEDGMITEGSGSNIGDVVDEDKVRIKVDDTADTKREQIGYEVMI